MNWTAPDVTRVSEPVCGPERAMLEGLLEWHRATLLHKCSGLGAESLAERAVPPSPISLLGLVRHMAQVEQGWFLRNLDGRPGGRLYGDDEPDADFLQADPARAGADFEQLDRAVGEARRIAALRALDDTFVHRRSGAVMSLRWLYLHMIEEYARHNGHADLLRERIDGAVGR